MIATRIVTILLTILLFLFTLEPGAQAQAPDAPWRTLETPHYRVHYPAPAESWARAAAERLEAIRERVAEEVGHRPAEVTDVLVSDPFSHANGSAWPILGWPRMVLWTTPPGPDSVIGFYRDWREILLIHEDSHLVHLLRPSRNPIQRRLGQLTRSSPVMLRSPRWVIEGYATLLEGQLTGSGRPHGDLRATILRRWAQLGELPSYGQLSGGGESWHGLSMAYLVGSAYLEWLVERTGPDALRNLWARLSARQDRSFDQAFVGVFGDSPAKLYNRFRAELTYRAMVLEKALEPSRHEGEVWQELSWTTGPPTLSPDGEHLALVLRSRDGPSRLVVWSTGPPTEEEADWREQREELARLDPDDVPAVRLGPLPREPLHLLVTRDGAEPHDPRWIPGDRLSEGAKSLLFSRDEPDSEGFLRPDLFRWRPEGTTGGPGARGRVERITHGAAVREADPAPGGDWAVAVRQRWGASQLVAVDLRHGAVEALTEPSIDLVFHHPRIAPDGRRLVVVTHRDGAWRLEIHRLEAVANTRRLVGEPRMLALPNDATVAHPAWGPKGRTVYAAVGEAGLIDLRAFAVSPVDPDAALPPAETRARGQRLTTSQGAALAPAPTPDGRAIFYLGLEADGLDLRRLDLPPRDLPPRDLNPSVQTGSQSFESPEIPDLFEELPAELSLTDLTPIVRPLAPDPIPDLLPRRPVGDDRAYGKGRIELLPLMGGAWGPSSGHVEAGVRGGDLVGRFDLLALVASGDTLRGGTLSGIWRGWPIELGLHLFAFAGSEGEERGLELSGSWDHRSRYHHLVLGGGALAGTVEDPSPDGGSLDRRMLYLEPRLALAREVGPVGLSSRLGLRWDIGETGGEAWQRWGGSLELTAALREGPALGIRWRQHDSGGRAHDVESYRLGGLDHSLRSEALRGGRIFAPALPPRFRSGVRAESLRFSLRHDRWPIELFVEQHRLADSASWGPWIDLRGVELRLVQRPRPLLRLPAFELRLGLAELTDGLDTAVQEGLENGDFEGWLSLRWWP